MFLVIIIVISLSATYFFLNFEKFIKKDKSSSNINLENCAQIDSTNIMVRASLVDTMRNYLAENENVPLTTPFKGSAIGEENCFSLVISDFEVYEAFDGSLVIIKNGNKYKIIPRDLWKK